MFLAVRLLAFYHGENIGHIKCCWVGCYVRQCKGECDLTLRKSCVGLDMFYNVTTGLEGLVLRIIQQWKTQNKALNKTAIGKGKQLKRKPCLFKQ